MDRLELAGHYRLIGIVNDQIVDDFICGANSKEDSACRDNSNGRCNLLDHFYGMSDFSAYRDNGYPRELISFKGDYNSTQNLFVKNDLGSDSLSIMTKDEYIQIQLNGEYCAGVNIENIEGFKILTLKVSVTEDEEFSEDFDYYRYTDTVWGIHNESEIITPDNNAFQNILSLVSDWYSDSSETNKKIKEDYLLYFTND